MLDTTTKIDTRTRILDVAESAVLAKGFASTSIEEIIAAVGITKSGFFYHFRDKTALAKGLMLRYLEHDKQVLEDIFARGDELNDDPLHGFLVGLKLFAEMLANMTEVHPGLSCRVILLSGATVQPRDPRTERQRHAGVAAAFPASASRRSRSAIRRVSRRISRRSPTWRRPWSRAG